MTNETFQNFWCNDSLQLSKSKAVSLEYCPESHVRLLNVVVPPLTEHKDSSDEKRSSRKGSVEKSNELSKPEPMEAEPPKAEVNGTAQELHSEGDTQSN